MYNSLIQGLVLYTTLTPWIVHFIRETLKIDLCDIPYIIFEQVGLFSARRFVHDDGTEKTTQGLALTRLGRVYQSSETPSTDLPTHPATYFEHTGLGKSGHDQYI